MSRTAVDVYREALAAFKALRDDPATSPGDQAIAASEMRRIRQHLAGLTLASLNCATCGGGVALGWTPAPGWRTTPSPVCRQGCAQWVHDGPAAGARRHLPGCCCAGREPESRAHECRCGCIQLQPHPHPHHGKPGYGPTPKDG